MNQSPPFVVFLVVQFFLRRSGLGERSVKHQDYISLYIYIFISKSWNKKDNNCIISAIAGNLVPSSTADTLMGVSCDTWALWACSFSFCFLVILVCH